MKTKKNVYVKVKLKFKKINWDTLCSEITVHIQHKINTLAWSNYKIQLIKCPKKTVIR